MAPFTRIRSLDREPEADEILEDLIEFHRERPGITERTLGECTTADGRTGYDIAAAAVPHDARTVLELGCGNGPLLERLLARRGIERVIGVDACASDLELARVRCIDPRLLLLNERGDTFSVERASIDAVVSHHAFYLMRPPEVVVARIAHALRPGGVFANVTTSMEPEKHPRVVAMMEAFRALTAPEVPHFTGWGDRRVFSRAGLTELLCEEPGGFAEPLEISEHTLEIREAADVLADRLIAFFYSAHLQSPETRDELRRAWIEMLSADATAEIAHLSFPFALVVARRR